MRHQYTACLVPSGAVETTVAFAFVGCPSPGAATGTGAPTVVIDFNDRLEDRSDAELERLLDEGREPT